MRSRSRCRSFFALIALAAVVGGCATVPGSAQRTNGVATIERPACSACVDALRVNGWCTTCAIGYVHAAPIVSEWAHEAFDAHGHEIEDWSHPCLDCSDALLSDGYCAHCSFGFIDGKLYFSKLTWSLGLGEVIDLWVLECASCLDFAGGAGWCDPCEFGLVGNARFDDREQFSTAQSEWQRLEDCLSREAGCARCVIYFYKDLPCGACARVKLRSDSKIDPPQAPGSGQSAPR